jgi:hypothetical protein
MEAAKTARPPTRWTPRSPPNKRDFDARYERAQSLFAKSDFTGAMDELLEIVMRDKGWKDGLARKTYVAILEIMSQAGAQGRPGGAEAGRARGRRQDRVDLRRPGDRRLPAQAEHGAVLTSLSRRRERECYFSSSATAR